MASSRTSPKRVVILGGGFGGVRAALRLDRTLPLDYDIVLVDRRAYHLPHWQLYETATASLLREERRDFEKIQALVGIPFAEIFKHTRVQFVQASVQDVFLSDRSVALSFPGNESAADGLTTGLLHFKFLVLALGAETNYFGIAGLSERAYGLKDLDDSLNLRDAVSELFSRKKRGEPIDLVVGGGGFTGVELAAELVGFTKRLAIQNDLDAADVHITIVEGGSCLLGGAAPWLLAAAHERLLSLGIRIVLQTPIEKYEKKEVVLAKGKKMRADLLVWTAGVRANSLLERILGAELTKTCMTVNERLELPLFSHVYGIGDNVYCFDAANSCSVPATAQRALDQADVAAANIVATIARKPRRVYVPKKPAFIVPLGGTYALADVYGVRLEGSLAWCAKMWVGFSYLASILPLPSAVRIAWQSVVLYTAND